MFNAKQFLQRVLLALSLTGAMALAQAEPMSYHVTVNTSGLTGTGYFDASMAQSTGVSQGLTATLSNFMGAFTGIDDSVSANYTTIVNGFLLSNAAPSYLSQEVNFGGLFSFDVLFSGAFFTSANDESSSLVFAVYDSTIAQLSAGGFDLAGTGANRITVRPNDAIVSISANGDAVVPEPTALLLMLTAFGLMAVMVKRRQA